MPRKSYLLEYIIAYADKLKNNDGKKSLSANYFMLSVLKVVEDMLSENIPAELDSIDAKKEITAVYVFLKKYDIGGARIKSIVNSITEDIANPSYQSTMDEVMYGKLNFNADAKAQRDGREVVDTIAYLELIVADPTESIRKHVLTTKQETAAPSSDFLSFLQFLDAKKNAGETVSEGAPSDNPADPPKDSAPEMTGAQVLADIVKTTRRVQSILLESVYGQDHAVNSFVSGYFQAQLMSYSLKDAQKTQATFLFAGPPGVGKTFLAEKTAEALGLPYQRFDMSEYSDKEANIEFCGSDKVYKNGKAGNVTEFVANNPKCVLLFDEIEKAHINVIHLFLQILDAGRIRDNFTDEEVSFSNAIIIFTTNVGRGLYEDPSIVNLSAVPRKKVLKALEKDINPATGAPLFPAAICSRFASGNVVMFNHLEANNLYIIAKRELDKNVKGLEAATGVKIKIDERVPTAIMFSEGGKADARTVKGVANAFFHEELYELFRLLASSRGADSIEKITQINVNVPLEGLSDDVKAMFENPEIPEVLILAGNDVAAECTKKLDGSVICHVVDSIDAAKDVLFNRDISVVLCDIGFGVKDKSFKVLNAEDVSSVGQDLLAYVLDKHSLPVYILQSKDGEISEEEFLSFAKMGVRDVLSVKGKNNAFAKQVIAKCKVAYQQGNMLKLARENKSLFYKTAQTVSKNGKTANINLFDFRLSLITDTDDSKNILDNVSRPDLYFDDVIGAEDAKDELKYFVEYLKNPIKFMRKGVRSPRGILLYGPPGTGKTLLAKAMAGESGVTFMRAEGNEFLKSHVGEGPEKVHSLFNAARKYAPSIVFIDEIDAIAKDRNMLSESTDHTSDVLTALLTELDGFNTDTSKPVFVLAATNYGVDAEKGKSLDAALLRRFDRRIYVDLPNKDERKKYLKMKIAKHPSVNLSEEQIDNIAMRSTGMSLAALESIFEMALRNAIRSENGIVSDAEFEEAFETFNSGEKKEWSSDALERTARHEAGHALVCWLAGEKPSYLTIVARGDHGGYMQHANSEDKGTYTKAELLNKIRTSLAGRAAEIVYYGTEDGISTGASGDLYSATKIAEQMICSYGMDDSLGMSYISSSELQNADNRAVRDKVNAMLDEQLRCAIALIEANKSAIDAIVAALIEKNHLKENEIDEIFTKAVK